MNEFHIKKTNTTPEVLFKGDLVLFSGRCIPDYLLNFYAPIIEQLKKCIEKKSINKIVFDLDYINTASSSKFFEIFKLFSDANLTEVEWIYEKDDEGILETGKDYEKMFTKLNFKFTEK